MKRVTVSAGGSVKYNSVVLDELRARIKDVGNARVKVGVLGSKAARTDSEGLNNPTIGAKHEFGSITERIPERSFLRMPLMLYLPEAIKAVGSRKWVETILFHDYTMALKRLGALAVGVVDDAFATGGFGRWPALSKRTVERKNSTAILIDTAQLRKSVDFEIQKGR